MKKITALMMLIIVFALVGCRTAQLSSPEMDADAKQFSNVEGMAVLFIYRDSDSGLSKPIEVDANGIKLGSTLGQTYMRLVLNPGIYNLVSKADNDATLSVTLQGGMTYFVHQSVQMQFLSSQSTLGLVGASEGRNGVKASHLLLTPEDIAVAPATEAVGAITADMSKATQSDQVSMNGTSSSRKKDNDGLRFGTSGVTVERLAMQRNCMPTVGANLVTSNGPIEDYTVACEDGRILAGHCEYHQCVLR